MPTSTPLFFNDASSARLSLKAKAGVYAIVDDTAHAAHNLHSVIRDIIVDSQIPLMQLRLKKTSLIQQTKLLDFCLTLKVERDVKIIFNDCCDLVHPAIDGYHVGQNDRPVKEARNQHPQAILGISTHSVQQAEQAVKESIDYIAVGALFATATKPQAYVVAAAEVKKIVAIRTLPLVAIGGINENTIAFVAEMGFTYAAMIAGLYRGKSFQGQNLNEKFIQIHSHLRRR